MTAISTIPKGSQISPVDERVYHQSNLVGDWKGTWKNSSRPVELKVINIRGGQAQIEYTHDGHKRAAQRCQRVNLRVGHFKPFKCECLW